MNALRIIFFAVAVYLKVVCTEQNIIGKAEKGNNVTIYWSLNVTKRTYTTATLRFDKIVVSTCKAAGGNGFTCVTPKNDKYEASFNKTDKQITLTILNLTYSDSGDYLAELDYKDGKKTRPERLTTTTIQVRGPPQICDSKFMKSYEFPQHYQPMVNITIYGYPTPRFSWAFGQNAKPDISIRSVKAHKHVFSAVLPNLTSSMCGSKLTLKASNKFGKVSTSAVINVSFLPSKVKDFSFAIKDNCQKFQWSILNSGQCGVFYEIQILDSKKRILSRSTTQPFANFLSFCYAKYTHNNVSAGIRAIYDNKYGNWSSVKPMKGYPETESNKTTLIVGVVCGACILLLLLMLLLCYVKRERGKNGSEVWKPKKAQAIDKTQFVDVSLLNMKSNPSEDYTDLSDHNKPTYAELQGHQSLYENMESTATRPLVNEYEVPNCEGNEANL